MARPDRTRLPTIRHILATAHRRLILFAVVLAGLLLMMSGVLVIGQYSERNVALLARTIAYTVEPALVFGDRDAVLQGVSSVADINGAGRVEVRGADGQPIAVWQRPEGTVDSRLERLGQGLLRQPRAEMAVRRGDRQIGTVLVDGASSALLRYLLIGIAISLCCIGITLLATRILARRLEEEVVAPLDRVVAVAHAVRTERRFERRVEPCGLAELDRLVTDFNALLAELQGWQASVDEQIDTLGYQATHDPLTRLGNRALFEATLNRVMTAARSDGHGIAVLYIDLDGFKRINDTFGHQAGDELLSAVAQRLQDSVRACDEAFRLGGDEFALVLAPLTDRAQAEGVRSRVSEAMLPPVARSDGSTLPAAISIGMAVFPDDGTSHEALLHHADEAMYQDKSNRRNGDRQRQSNA